MIGFALSEDQVAAQKWAREFAEREIRPVAPHYDETEDFPWPVLSKAADIGLYGMDFYRMIGEDETGILQPLLVEELCWGCAGISLGIFGSGLPLVALIASGTPDQVARDLLKLQQDTGMTYSLLRMRCGGMDPKGLERSMRLFAEEVMPAFKNG